MWIRTVGWMDGMDERTRVKLNLNESNECAIAKEKIFFYDNGTVHSTLYLHTVNTI